MDDPRIIRLERLERVVIVLLPRATAQQPNVVQYGVSASTGQSIAPVCRRSKFVTHT